MEFKRYEKTDYDAVCAFLVALNQTDRTHIHWNWARFEWMVGHPECDRSLLHSVGLWRDGGAVVGAAIYDMYFGEAFCGVLPGHETLYPAVLDYAWRELRDENGLGIALCDGSAWELDAAKAAGFCPAEQTETVMSLPLDRPLMAALPEGLHLTELDQTDDLAVLEWLFWQGFDHGADRAEFEREGRGGGLPRPHFNKQLSLAAATGGGEPVAFCGLWYLPGTDYAYVEPVCTVPEWRGRGAGRAVVSEALDRARSLGAKRAYVISDQAFYERLGFRPDRHYTFRWKKEGN